MASKKKFLGQEVKLTEEERAERFRVAAREKHAVEGEIEIDDGAEVSETTCTGGDEGAYVQAWVWVSDEEAGLKDEKG